MTEECPVCKRRKKVTKIVSASLLIIFVAMFIYSIESIVNEIGLSYAASYIDTEDEAVQIGVEEVKEICQYEDTVFYEHCLLTAIENWIYLNIDHDMHLTPPSFAQTPSLTYQLGEGNCVDKAIFTASILKGLGFKKVFLVSQKHHMCVLVQTFGNDFRFIHCLTYADTLDVKKV